MKITPLNLSFILILILFSSPVIRAQESDSLPGSFTFAFLTDIHVQPERHGAEGFLKAVDVVNKLQPDFVLTGGDLIMDALGKQQSRADSLYQLYLSVSARLQVPLYNTPGNHEGFGLYEKSGVSLDDPLFGKKMYEHYLGKRFYSFDHQGWHFMVLDATDYTPERRYIGHIDSTQMAWIADDLSRVDPATPIVISTHIPFLTLYTQWLGGPFLPNEPGLVVDNFADVLGLYGDHNLRLVLQGHLHFLESIEVGGITFLTGGAVSARWWTGPNYGMEEGFVLLRMAGDDFSWEYIDFDWEVSPEDRRE